MDTLRPPRFSLSLLGTFALIGPDGPVNLPSKKLAGLLAYLALTEPAPQPRDKLITLFWGSHFEVQARQNLRKARFRLRHALGRMRPLASEKQSRWHPAWSLATQPGCEV